MPSLRQARLSRREQFKAAEWTLCGETADGAPRGIFRAERLTCAAESAWADNDAAPVELWALRHTGLHPAHRQFTFRAERFWHVHPAPGNPCADGGDGT